MATSKFPCTGCGLCCKIIGHSIGKAKTMVAQGSKDPIVIEVASFPYSFDEKGNCENLNADNTCKVYDQRPDICSVERTWQKHEHKRLTKEEYFQSSAMMCNSMMVEAGIEDRYYIPVPPEAKFML